MSSQLPYFDSANNALEYFDSENYICDPTLSLVIATLSRSGLKNSDIRKRLGIEKVYTVTHYKRCGSALSRKEMELWFNNREKLKLGHIRAICSLEASLREELMRDTISKRISVGSLEQIAKAGGKAERKDSDIGQYQEKMEEVLGRPINLEYNNRKGSGKLSLTFYGLDDLDSLSEALGFRFNEDF